jgi:hypothetical protein
MVFVGCPVPRETLLGWCAVCAAEYKWSLISDSETAQKVMDAKDKPDKGKPAIIHPPTGFQAPPVELAVTSAPAVQFSGAIVPLCWTHVPALQPPEPAPPNGHAEPGAGLLKSGPLPGLGKMPGPRTRGRDA